MHTSQTPLAVSCEDACRTVPSPLAGPHKGGGTGRGVAINAARAKLILRVDQNTKSNENCFCPRRIENRHHPCCTPLPVPPPQGGRERCGTALRIFQRCARVQSQDEWMP